MVGGTGRWNWLRALQVQCENCGTLLLSGKSKGNA